MPKQVYIYGDSLLKATMPDEGYHYHFHYDEVLQRYPERQTQVVNRSKMGATISKGESLVQHDLNRGLEADYALVAYGGNDSDFDWAAIDADPGADHRPNTELPVFADTLHETLDALRQGGVQPVMMTLPPIDGERYLDFLCRDNLRRDRILAGGASDDLSPPGAVRRHGGGDRPAGEHPPDPGAADVSAEPPAVPADRRRRHPPDHGGL